MERQETTKARWATRRYLIEFTGTMVLYMVVLFAVVPFVNGRPESPWRVPVALLPLVPVGLMVWVVVRHYARVDEMARRAIVESAALGYLISAPIVITLGFLDTAGLELSIWWAWVAMGFAWGLSACLLQLRYR